MDEQFVGINEVHVAKGEQKLTCYGLGSCIGLFIQDRVAKISGAAHIASSTEWHGAPLSSADALLDKLLSQFVFFGSDLVSLRAKVAGGASLFSVSMKIGDQNAFAVVDALVQRKIFIAASDCGGSVSRSATFDPVTGMLKIKTSEKKTYSI